MVALTLLGYWLDRRYGWQPWGVLVGALLGLVGGMYNLIRDALEAVRSDNGKPKKSARSDET
ncbi:MAG: AtpZ/AtpI family protein [Deltaproteobacteria bacterium]|nr:AtpZ/AtpI family protein [Deltaproteobacteria bacterium]